MASNLYVNAETLSALNDSSGPLLAFDGPAPPTPEAADNAGVILVGGRPYMLNDQSDAYRPFPDDEVRVDLDCYPELAAVIACHSLLVEDRAGQEWEASVGDLVKAGLSISAYVDAGTLDGSALLLVEEGGQLLSSTLAEVVTAGFNPAEFGPQSHLDADSETLLLSQGGEVGRTALRDLGRFMPAFWVQFDGRAETAEAERIRAAQNVTRVTRTASGHYLLDLEVALPSADPCLFTTLGSSGAAAGAAGPATSLQASAVTRQQIEVLCLTAEGRQQDAAQLSVGGFC